MDRGIAQRGSVMLIVLAVMSLVMVVAAVIAPRHPVASLRQSETLRMDRIIRDARTISQILVKSGDESLSGSKAVPLWLAESLRRNGLDVMGGTVILSPQKAGIFSVQGVRILQGRITAEVLKSSATQTYQGGSIRFMLRDVLTAVMSSSVSSAPTPLWSPEMVAPQDPAYGYFVESRRMTFTSDREARFTAGQEIARVEMPPMQADRDKWFAVALRNIDDLVVSGRVAVAVECINTPYGSQRILGSTLAAEGMPAWFRPTWGLSGTFILRVVAADGYGECVVRPGGWVDYELYSKEPLVLGRRSTRVVEF